MAGLECPRGTRPTTQQKPLEESGRARDGTMLRARGQQTFCGYVPFVTRLGLGGDMLWSTTAQVCYHSTYTGADQMQSN